MEPLYFGGTARGLFGLRFEPRTTPRNTGILICSSWGMEYMRSYRGLSLLARQLSERGFETLRFDYSCTGDSIGDASEGSVDQWIADIGLAARELSDLSGCTRLCILGLRLGALLALHAADRGLRVDDFALWDPPGSGESWLQDSHQLESGYYQAKNRYRSRNNQLATSREELFGLPLPSAQAAVLARLATPVVKSARPPCAMLSTDQTTGMVETATRLALPEPAHWRDPDWLTTPWTPTASIRAITEHFATWLR